MDMQDCIEKANTTDGLVKGNLTLSKYLFKKNSIENEALSSYYTSGSMLLQTLGKLDDYDVDVLAKAYEMEYNQTIELDDKTYCYWFKTREYY